MHTPVGILNSHIGLLKLGNHFANDPHEYGLLFFQEIDLWVFGKLKCAYETRVFYESHSIEGLDS